MHGPGACGSAVDGHPDFMGSLCSDLMKAGYPQPAIPVGHNRGSRSDSIKPIILSEIAFDNTPSYHIFYPCLSMFSGNTADVTTNEKVKADLRGWDPDRAMFVADAGMNSEANRKELARACGKCLGVR